MGSGVTPARFWDPIIDLALGPARRCVLSTDALSWYQVLEGAGNTPVNVQEIFVFAEICKRLD